MEEEQKTQWSNEKKFYNVFNDLKKTITFQNDFFTFPPVNDPFTFIVIFKSKRFYSCPMHWGKADGRNCNYGHPKMADMKLGKNLFCRLNCFYNVF
jgi:hypothetical protein